MPVILEVADEAAVVVISAAQIDRDGAGVANVRALTRALEAVAVPESVKLVDWLDGQGVEDPAQPVEHGDGTSAVIAAASIVAKETRDQLMRALDGEYPDYGFATHCLPRAGTRSSSPRRGVVLGRRRRVSGSSIRCWQRSGSQAARVRRGSAGSPSPGSLAQAAEPAAGQCDWLPAGRVLVCIGRPASRDQRAVPASDRFRPHEHALPAIPRKLPSKRAEHNTVEQAHAPPTDLATKHREFMTQNDDLNSVFGV